MLIVKNRSATSDWYVYHAGMATPSNNVMFLNGNGGNAASTAWNNTAPTSSVFTVRCDTTPSTGARFRTFGAYDYVAYCWAEIAGFSKFGSYVGNFSANGPFVYTGFRPEFILGKDTTVAGQEWFIYDTARNTFNVANRFLSPTFSQAETASTGVGIDILSNGFKIRMADNRENRSGSTYIYMAFAENPFKNANAR
jgi:hypothetical protein